MAARAYKAVVLVVDDDDEVRALTQDLLEEDGFRVLTARDGIEALARMKDVRGPALAIVDLVMPGMDGWDLIETIRADRSLEGIRILAVSGRGTTAVQGADRVIPKPVAPEELLRHLAELNVPGHPS